MIVLIDVVTEYVLWRLHLPLVRRALVRRKIQLCPPVLPSSSFVRAIKRSGGKRERELCQTTERPRLLYLVSERPGSGLWRAMAPAARTVIVVGMEVSIVARDEHAATAMRGMSRSISDDEGRDNHGAGAVCR